MSNPITQVIFQNAGVLSLEGGYTSFGQTFQQGDLKAGQQLLATIGGQVVPVQVDVRNTYPDGSVKMAVLTMDRPGLEPWQEVTATLQAGGTAPPAAAVSLSQVLAGHSAALTLAIEDGRPPLTIDIDAVVRQAISNGTASFWQQGPQATQARVEIPVADSSMRVVLDVTGYADGEIRFTVGLNNDRAMEAEGGRLNYVATVTLDGETVFNQGLSHGQYQRVSLDFASDEANGTQGLGAPQEGWLNIKHDVEYLKDAGAIFEYDTSFVADAGALRHYYEQVANNPQWGEIFWNHEIQTQMGNVGGRPDIGYTTAPNANWLLSQDAAAAEYALGQAKVAGYVPWNFYDMANGTVLNTDNYPKLWTDARGGTGTPGAVNSSGLTQQVGADTGWGPDTAHQPDLSYIPYILTGERWMYDNIMSQASHSIHYTWPVKRGAEGGLVIQDNQIRASAWSLRQIDHAAWVAEDGSTEQDYFARVLEQNWDWILSNVDTWTATYGELAGFIPTSASSDRTQAWQMNMLAGVVAMSAIRGSEEALEVLDFMSNFMLGALNSAADGLDPHNAANMSLPIRYNGQPITSWAELGEVLRATGEYADGTFGRTELEYQRMLVAGLTMAYEATGDARYRDAAEIFLKLGPPGTGTSNYIASPQYAVTFPELHDAYRPDTRFPDSDIKPVAIDLGTGPDEIVLRISQDYFSGPAQYRVFVDGKQMGGTLTASALKSLAGADTVTIRGDFGDTVTVRVQMVNDLYSGAGSRDRNLYVNAISYNGQDLPTRAYLGNNTAQDFVFKADGTMISPPALVKPEPNEIPVPGIDPLPPKTVTLGEGPDEVILKIAQDWYLDSAQYVVLLDGVQLGGVQQASAFRSAGQTDTLLVRGDFSDGPAKIVVRYVNDKTDGYGRDRNLHVQSGSIDGDPVTILPKTALMSQNETATIAIDHPDLTPKTVVIGTGPNELAFKINQNYWKGKAEYVVLVDGAQYGERQKANATAANDEYDTVLVRGSFVTGTKIGLKFMNDGQASPTEGRDIFVHSATMDGTALALSRTNLLTTGQTSLATIGNAAKPPSEPPPTEPPPPPPPTQEPDPTLPDVPQGPGMHVFGSGPDEVVIRLSHTPATTPTLYRVFVGMDMYGDAAGLAVESLKSAGVADTVIVRGDFSSAIYGGSVYVGVFYMNGYGQGALHIEGVSVNGHAVPKSVATMTTVGISSFNAAVLPADPGSEPDPQPEPQPDPDPQPEPQPDPDPQPEPQPDPDPQPEPQPDPDPEPEPQPDPDPEPEPQPEPDPEPVSVGSGSDLILFKFAFEAMAGAGSLGIEVDGVRLYDSTVAPTDPFGVTVAFDPGSRTEFAIVYDGAGAGPSVTQVAHDGTVLATLGHSFSSSGSFRFAFHKGNANNELHSGSGLTDVFILGGGMDTIITGGGADLLVVREPGTYIVADFDPTQDRLQFEAMQAESLALTQLGNNTMIGFEGGSVLLSGRTGLTLEQILSPPHEPFG